MCCRIRRNRAERTSSEWIGKNEIVESGGEAMVLDRPPTGSRCVQGAQDARAARAKHFEQLAGEVSKLLTKASVATPADGAR